MQKSTQSLTLITRGSEPLMEKVRRLLTDMQLEGYRLAVITSFTGDVSYDQDAVALFIGNESAIQQLQAEVSADQTITCLWVGLKETPARSAPTWAPKARVLIALSPELSERALQQELTNAVHGARKALADIACDSLPVLNRPSADYILALEERDGIIGS